ncbi:cell division protein CrgA [Frigoribacterium sp. VKM Ac-1396]|uniref:cell division protein CrgA n=2 Tax=Microbacteriaceae TaxID=85023 RepID=UPI00188D74F1|nr:cell division protein CrgA [Frigoribacterium sp. VKM Ac-1396]MBF4601942.1 cell division protein CrgA [Frigoribacterium sp. VKM Ac-1396]
MWRSPSARGRRARASQTRKAAHGTLCAMAKDTNRSTKPARTAEDAPNPVWFKPVMFGFMLVGLAWIVVFYVSQSTLPVASLGSWNILVGFGIMFIGFLMTTRWR